MSEATDLVRARGATVEVRDLRKSYAGKPAVDGVSLRLERGEILALLGPSGCGKTTTLGMIAGLVRPDGGDILLDGEPIADMPPWRRNLGMLFQSYALFPHLTVLGNVAFGLEMRRVSAAEIDRRARAALATVELQDYADRMPRQLSGGQQQRVALARALVYEPRVLLLDEPFGALDRRLRDSMQVELRALCERLGLTTILVTHDQEEALTLADRIALMRDARLAQVDTSWAIYDRPRSRFVADFLGTSNFLEGRVVGVGADEVVLEGADGTRLVARPGPPVSTGARALVAVRAESVELQPTHDRSAVNAVAGTVEQVVFKGQSFEVFLRTPQGSGLVVLQRAYGGGAVPVAGERWTAIWSAAAACIVEDDGDEVRDD